MEDSGTRPQAAAAVTLEAARSALVAGARSLATVTDAALLRAWGDTVESFLDPESTERRRLDPTLLEPSGESAAALQAGIEAVLRGGDRRYAERLFDRCSGRRSSAPLLIVLAGNIPGLVVQPLLPALALRRPTVIKPPSGAVEFPRAFVAGLVERLPPLGRGVRIESWRGGDDAVETIWLAAVSQVVAYGGSEAVDSLRRRFGREILDYGPKLSLAFAVRGSRPREFAEGLSRDIALFEQRGCLSVQALFVDGDRHLAQNWGEAIAAALAERAREWPPPTPGTTEAGRLQQIRVEARSRGCWVAELGVREGTVIVEAVDQPRVEPSPGLRTLRIYPVESLASALSKLECYRGRLQGVALTGAIAPPIYRGLETLGVSRFAAPGQLQTPDASWLNGGRDLLEALAREHGGEPHRL